MFGLPRKKKDKEPEKPPIYTPLPGQVTQETTTIENVKSKMDLVLSRLDSLRTEHETLNERVGNMERMLKEIYAMAKS